MVFLSVASVFVFFCFFFQHADLVQSEKKRCESERQVTEMDHNLRSLHRRLTETAAVNQSLSAELNQANDLVRSGDEVSSSKVKQLEAQLTSLKESYTEQVRC